MTHLNYQEFCKKLISSFSQSKKGQQHLHPQRLPGHLGEGVSIHLTPTLHDAPHSHHSQPPGHSGLKPLAPFLGAAPALATPAPAFASAAPPPGVPSSLRVSAHHPQLRRPRGATSVFPPYPTMTAFTCCVSIPTQDLEH